MISIGNISFGGTGKTPITIELAKYLSGEMGLKVGVITRGYKCDPKLKKSFPIILNATKPWEITPTDIGDEPYMMYEKFKTFAKDGHGDIILIIDSNRYRGGKKAIEEHYIDVLILDDGLQHIQLHRDLEIIVKNVREKGFFREFPLAEKKADYIFYTKVDDQWIANHPDKISVKYKISLMKNLDLSKGVYAFTATGDPDYYFDALYAHILSLDKHSEPPILKDFKTRSFPDHHVFSDKDVRELLSGGMNLSCTIKDIVKIPDWCKEKFIPVDLSIEFNPKNILAELGKRVINGSNGRKQ